MTGITQNQKAAIKYALTIVPREKLEKILYEIVTTELPGDRGFRNIATAIQAFTDAKVSVINACQDAVDEKEYSKY